MATIDPLTQQQDSCLMKRPFFSLFLFAALAMGAVLPAAAEKADRDKPMNAEADALRYDDLKQSSIFTGNVVITKGSTIIRGQQVDVSQDPEGYQQAIAIAGAEEPEHRGQGRDRQASVEAEAASIEGEGAAIGNTAIEREAGRVEGVQKARVKSGDRLGPNLHRRSVKQGRDHRVLRRQLRRRLVEVTGDRNCNDAKRRRKEKLSNRHG